MAKRLPFLKAAAEDDLETIKRLIPQGFSVNEMYEDKILLTAMFVACEHNSIEVVRFLVENGVCVETADVVGKTCLMICCRKGNLEIIDYLLSKGSRINRSKEMGSTALHVCGAAANPEVLHALLKSGGVMRKDEYGCSPIMCSAKFRGSRVNNGLFYLDSVTSDDFALQFGRHFHRKSDDVYLSIDPNEKMTAYAILGAFTDYTLTSNDDIRKAWVKVISIRKEAGLYPAQIVKTAPTCICDMRIYSNESESLTNKTISGSAWSEVSMAAREVISGLELLRRARKRDGMNWIPCFSCPTCPYQRCSHFVVSTSLGRSKRYRLCDEVYQSKWQQINSEIQTVYGYLVYSKVWHHNGCTTTQNQFLPCSQPSQAKDSVMHLGIHYERHENVSNRLSENLGPYINIGDSIQPSSTVDVILGVEPICFVHTRYDQNDVDPSSYYLLRHWLTSRYFNHPRTTYRSSYSVCTACGKIIIYFDVAYGCASLHIALSDSSTSKGLLCKLCIEAFGESGEKLRKDVDTYVNVPGPSRLISNSYYVQPCTRIKISTNKTSAGIVCPCCGLVSEQHPLLQRLHKRWIEVFGDMRSFDSVDELKEMMNSLSTIQLQQTMICLRHLSVYDPDGIARIHEWYVQTGSSPTRHVYEKLYFCILEFQRIFMDSMYFEKWSKFIVFNGLAWLEIVNTHLMVESLEVAVNYVEREIFSRDHFEIPFKAYTAVEGYDTTRTYEFPPAENQPLSENHGNSDDHMKHKFISQVCRLVFLDPRIDNGASLIHCTYSCILDDRHIPVFRLMLQLGANPDCVDYNGQTAFGYFLSDNTLSPGIMINYLVTLMEGGAHLDGYKRSSESDERYRFFLRQKNICPVRHGRLACLIASFMQRTDLVSNDSIVKAYLPDCFVTFLGLH